MILRTDNKFDQDEFLALKYNAIQAVIELNPIGAIAELTTRIQDTEASVGEKALLFDVLGNAAAALSDRPTESKDRPKGMSLEAVMLKQD